MFCKIKEVFFGKKNKKILSVKDPMDWSLTESSTAWLTTHYCPVCFSQIFHREIMSRICNKCGSKRDLLYCTRASRQIWNGENWVWQHKYGDSPSDYTINNSGVRDEYLIIR